jgi:hypothetical protein
MGHAGRGRRCHRCRRMGLARAVTGRRGVCLVLILLEFRELIYAWSHSSEATWSSLTNSLAGLFCASLNRFDSDRTTSPSRTFRPAHLDPSSGQCICFFRNAAKPAFMSRMLTLKEDRGLFSASRSSRFGASLHREPHTVYRPPSLPFLGRTGSALEPAQAV